MPYPIPPQIVEVGVSTNVAPGTANSAVRIAAVAGAQIRIVYARLVRRVPATAGSVTVFIRDTLSGADVWLGSTGPGVDPGSAIPEPGLPITFGGSVTVIDVGSAASLPYQLLIGYFLDLYH